MTENPAELALTYLRRIEVNIDAARADLRDIGSRLTSLEAAVSLLHGDFTGQSARIDRIDGRLERIERRLDRRGRVPTTEEAGL